MIDNFKDNDAFCPLPWTGIYIEPDGRTDTCCISKNRLGNINENKISDIVTSKKNIEIKSDMLAQKRVSGCNICYPAKEITSESTLFQRSRQLSLHNNFDKNIYSDANQFELRYVDLRLHNTCNYACVYCSPTLSSTWAKELKLYKQSADESLNDTISYVCDNIKTIKFLYLAGGEPLLIKENEIILAKLLQENPECNVFVNTNLSLIKNNTIFSLLQKFKNVQWTISVDDMGERYNYIRYPGVWDIFVENLCWLRDNSPETHDINFNMVYCALNAKTIFDTIDYFVSLGFAKEKCSINYINGGTYNNALDPRNLPISYIKETIEVINNYPKILRWPTFNEQLNFISDYLNSALENPNSYKLDLFEFLDTLDLRRNLDSKKIFSDIYASRQI
jgi:MoaA/NifB/PqqE/SkfB family radical SAM enzyme